MSRTGQSYLDLVLGTDAAELRKRSPSAHAASIEVPVLLIHGTEDFRVDYKHATLMKAALEKAGKPVEWLALRGEGHGVYDDKTRQEVYQTILTFLDKHLKASASGSSPSQTQSPVVTSQHTE
jgi:dipeptidyl aminopeptidase/acylaminoacyl peptidase